MLSKSVAYLPLCVLRDHNHLHKEGLLQWRLIYIFIRSKAPDIEYAARGLVTDVNTISEVCECSAENQRKI